MSSPQSDLIARLVERVLEKTAALSTVELGASLGVDSSYITKLRQGWRPSRMRPEILRRFEQFDPSGPRQTPQPPGFYDGILYAAQAMAETQGRLIAEARAGLAAALGSSKELASDLSRAVADLEAEAAVLDQLPSLPAAAPKKQKRRA